MRLLNLTGFATTELEKGFGIFNASDVDRKRITALLEFETKPTFKELQNNCDELIAIAKQYPLADGVVIEGPCFILSTLEFKLQQAQIKYHYIFWNFVSDEPELLVI